MSLAASEITFLKAKIKILEGKPAPVVAKKPKTLAQKKKQAQYMRTYMAKKKAAKTSTGAKMINKEQVNKAFRNLTLEEKLQLFLKRIL